MLLAEDYTIVRKGLRALLADEAGIEVIAEAEDGREAVRLTEELQPDVVLMDFSMPGLNGLEATRQIKRWIPEVKVLVLTRHADQAYVFQILRAGASGYVVKKAAPAELVSAIRAVSRGDSFLSPTISRTVIEEYIAAGRGDGQGQLRATDRPGTGGAATDCRGSLQPGDRRMCCASAKKPCEATGRI